jgi:hypothetical protein
MPNVIDNAQACHICQNNAELFLQFPPHGLPGTFAFVNAAARWTVKADSSPRVDNFGNKERPIAPDHAQGRLPGFDFHRH